MAINYRANYECDGCLEDAQLVMPVKIFTIGGEIEIRLCLNCRINYRAGEWDCLMSDIEHRDRRRELCEGSSGQ